MPQERLFRAGSPGARAPADSAPAWRLAERTNIRVGTASWTDRTLLEPDLFYPAELRTPADRLRFYASSFPIVEVDSTYYALPSERNAKAWVERTPSGFVFNVKAFALMTHHPTPPRSLPPDLREMLPADVAEKRNVYLHHAPDEIVEQVWERFCGAIAPLADAGRLGAVLFQFPEWFTPSRESRSYLLDCAGRLRDLLPDAWCAVEFRNSRWMADPSDRERTLGFLEANGLPYVCVDMPQGFNTSLPPVAAATAPLAMVRFHGRRSETWDKRGIPTTERFQWDYTPDELREWTPRLGELSSQAREVHVLMNNCYRDYAVRSASGLATLLTN